MKVENKISIAVAICFLALGMAISALKITVSSGILTGIFAVGLSLLATSLYKHFKYGEEVEQDERTKKIMYRALAGSWIATLVLVTLLMMAERFNVKLDVTGALSIIFFFMVFSFSAFNAYFDKKGE